MQNLSFVCLPALMPGCHTIVNAMTCPQTSAGGTKDDFGYAGVHVLLAAAQSYHAPPPGSS